MEGVIARHYLGQYETLEQHIVMCLEVSQKIGSHALDEAITYLPSDLPFLEWLSEELRVYLIYYHDTGKQTSEFQQKVKHNLGTKSPHAIHSAVIYLQEAGQRMGVDLPKQQLWAYLISYVIASHHGEVTPSGLYKYEQTLQQYLMKQDYLKIGWVDGQVIHDYLEVWQAFDWECELTLREFGVLKEALNYLQSVDHEAAYQFMLSQLSNNIYKDDVAGIDEFTEQLKELKATLGIEINIGDEVKRYMEKLAKDRVGERTHARMVEQE